MPGELLDYSTRITSPDQVKAFRDAGYEGAIRYMGTPGRAKNLTREEARWFAEYGLTIAAVYEETAGWMQGGRTAGIRAAKAVIADATNCGVGLVSCHFACDEEVRTSAQMDRVMKCLEGGKEALGHVQGVYGQFSVVEEAFNGGHAYWCWQTLAWSRKRISSKAHVLQQIGYVHPGGVECDRNTILQRPYGGWKPNQKEEDVPNTAEELKAAAYAALEKWSTERHDAQPAATLREMLSLFKPEVVQSLRDVAASDVPAALEGLKAQIAELREAASGTQLVAEIDYDKLARAMVSALAGVRLVPGGTT